MLIDLAQPVVVAQPARVATVRLGEYFYRPKRLTVRVGGKVRFLNVGKLEHTVADTDARGSIRSKVIKPRLLGRGRSQTVTFRRAGIVRYLCTLHPTLMRGVVTVKR